VLNHCRAVSQRVTEARRQRKREHPGRDFLAAALLAAVSTAGSAAAQPYPARPLRIIIPFSPGGATDTPARLIAQRLPESIGQPVIIDNRPGAGSALGSEIVAKAQPDGYTLLLTGTPFAAISTLYGNLRFDPARDFVAVMQVASAPNVLAVHPSLPVRSVKELVAAAQARPGGIDYASGGSGGAQHLFMSLLLSMARINMTHVPYKGSGPATVDLLGGQVKVGLPGVAIAIPHVKAGRLVPLGVTSAQRVSLMPDVPSIAEAGVPGYDATVWFGLLAPRGTPSAAIARLHAEISKVIRQPEVESGYLATGTLPVTSTPAEFDAFVKAEIAKWGRVIREAGIKPE
jgi:tripartite-type tricarboxylate transporter receptor subunit TctC